LHEEIHTVKKQPLFYVPTGLILAFLFSANTATGAAVPPQEAIADPAGLVRRAVANEVKSNNDNVSMMFQVRKQSPKSGVQTRRYIETKDGTAGILVANNDQPLTPEQHQQELARLDHLLQNPAELRRKQKQQKEDSVRVMNMLKALPDAFLYTYDGKTTSNDGDELVRLAFRPNPDYEPPSREQQVFTGMNGFLLVDADKERIARIDGTLFKDVSFGWGILGHLDKGGKFIVVQGPVGKGYWTTTHMQLSFNGKALFFKTITIQETEDTSSFHQVPNNLTYAQGVELLKKGDQVVAENGGGGQK